MTATTAAGPRFFSLDLLRGIAVMGILAMNIIAFSMPFQAYLNPRAYGGADGADLLSWVVAFIFVDGKMRAMFSMLFGASMLLVIERAEGAAPGAGLRVHFRRMGWLLVFGLIHFFLIWYGDILTYYAIVGMVAYLFRRKGAPALMKWSIGFLVLTLIVYAAAFVSPLALEAAAAAPGADPALVAQWTALKSELAAPSDAAIARDLAIYRGSFSDIVHYTVTERWSFLVQSVIMFGPETLALMLLGMWGLKSGFLTAAWEARRYRRAAIVCLGISVPAYVLLAWAIAAVDFDPAPTLALQNWVTTPFRPVMTFGYAALVILLAQGGAPGPLGTRIAAAGRAAFTNYLGTSLIATFIFYGWGLGLYGRLGRAESYLVVLGIWIVMLLWSKPWLDRYRYGPLEWLWRTLARGEAQAMRRPLPAA